MVILSIEKQGFAGRNNKYFLKKSKIPLDKFFFPV